MSNDKTLSAQAAEDGQPVDDAREALEADDQVRSAQSTTSGHREAKRPRTRRRAAARPNTSSTSPRSIKAAQRRADALGLRLQGHPYSVIGKHLGVSTAKCGS